LVTRTTTTTVPPALEELVRSAGHERASITPLAGDVGRRRYFRIRLGDNRSAIGVVYPDEEEDSRRRWVAAHERLRPIVRVPSLLADDGRGNQIVEDLGIDDLASTLAATPQRRERWLARAAEAAASIAAVPDPGINPAFDAALFRRELELAREAVFDLWLRAPLSSSERAAHDAWADALVAEILEHPSALCHRDFHANNLFASSEDEVGVIDFQDLRRGPDSYDLASLLWERTTLAWMNEETAGRVVELFAQRRGVEAAGLTRRLRRVLLQRAWKVCGTFARAVVQGRGTAYLGYLPPQLALVRRLLGESPSDQAFGSVLGSRIASVC
jgi:aminoglycoside/choline kinase family phosphotransferase